MTRRLITFLGTTDYKPLTYALPGGNARVTTPFVARAIGELMNCDDIIVMTTRQAWNSNGQKLAQALCEIGVCVKRHCIPDGRNEADLREQFRTVTKAIGEAPGAAVLDITHGFRIQPFFAATALAVLAATGDLPPDLRLTYGAAEATDENGITPIWDLSPFLLMQELAQGIATFRQTGHGGPLIAALERERRQLAARRNRQERADFSRSEPLVKAIRRFTQDLATLRLPALTIGPRGDRSSAQRLLDALRDYADHCRQDHPALMPLLDDLANMARPLPAPTLFGEKGKKALTALARLYLQLDRPLEAAAVAREGYVALFADGPDATDAGREGFDDRARRKAETRAMATETGRGIADIRNDLLHAGLRRAPQPADRLHRNAERAVDSFANAAPEQPPAGRNFFVTRHDGAVEWARRQGIEAEPVEHLDPQIIAPGDTVLGTLPVHLVAQICMHGGRYLHLVLDLPPEARGRELTAEDMEKFNARLEPYEVRRTP